MLRVQCLGFRDFKLIQMVWVLHRDCVGKLLPIMEKQKEHEMETGLT